MDSKLGLRFNSKMNQQPEYLIANSFESVKQTKQIGVSRLSVKFPFRLLVSSYFQPFQLCFAILGNWLNGFYS
jgi:hypothetical protein